ncbi:MAG: glycosyltransferase family 2 protein [Planctomycetota bacterium]
MSARPAPRTPRRDPAEVERWLAVAPVEPLTDAELPRVSIVILNWNGRHHLGPCFETLRALDYPADRFEVILVDNGSDDGSQAEIRAKYGWVRLVENARNIGFAAGCNQGAREAQSGPLKPTQLVFLNNDIHVDKGFLRALVAPVTRGVAIAATAKMFSWDGKVLNSAAGGMNFHGIGLQRGYLAEPAPEFDTHRKSLFACGGAMSMDLDAFFAVGGFDEEFFAYYEDVDLGWRTWVHGYEVHYEPRAICYHHHSSTSRRLPVERLRLIQIRNPLLACVKNYDDANFKRVLPAMLALATRRALVCSGLSDQRAYRIEELETLGGAGPVASFWGRFKRKLPDKDVINKVAIADLIGINDLLGRWDHWMERRRQVQAGRRRSDDDILPLFLRPHWCIEDEGGYRELQAGITQFMGLDELFDGLTTLTQDPPR